VERTDINEQNIDLVISKINRIAQRNSTDIEKALILLNNYNLKSLGMGQVDTEDSSLMKELAAKIILQS
jgi:hypothetical protein